MIGASLSAEFFTQNPVSRALQRLGLRLRPRNLARFGVPGPNARKALPEEEILSSAFIAGIDLFFWDTVYPPFSPSLEALEKLCALTEMHRIPMLQGTAPLLSFKWLQLGHGRINAGVRAACQRYANCILLDMDAINERIKLEKGFPWTAGGTGIGRLRLTAHI